MFLLNRIIKVIDKAIHTPWYPSVSKSATVVDLVQTRRNILTGKSQARFVDCSQGKESSARFIKG